MRLQRDQTLQQYKYTVRACRTTYGILRCDWSVFLMELTTLGRIDTINTFQQPPFNSICENKALYVYIRSRTPLNYCAAVAVVHVFQCASRDQTLLQVAVDSPSTYDHLV